MIKLYKAVVLTQNEHDYIQVRYCNDLSSRIYRLNRDKFNVIKQYEHTTTVSKLELCNLLLNNVTFDNDEQQNTVSNEIMKLSKRKKE